MRQTFDSSFREFKLAGINRENKPGTFAIRLLQSRGLQWNQVEVTAAHPLAAVFEIGGGNAKLRSGDITVENLAAVPEPTPPVRFQGGPFAPENCTVSSPSSD